MWVRPGKNFILAVFWIYLCGSLSLPGKLLLSGVNDYRDLINLY